MTVLAAVSLIAACGGGGSSTSTTTAPSSNTGNNATVQGVSTPSSVAVVTAR